jgi:dihydrofolate reductase
VTRSGIGPQPTPKPKVVAGMTLSLDGYVHDAQGSVEGLYPDLAELPETKPLAQAIRETGAVLMGRNTFDMAGDPDFYAGNYEFQVPIFVLTRQPPDRHPKETADLTFTFVTDGLEHALEQAKTAAGERDVCIVGGSTLIQSALERGLIDELHIDIMPVMFGSGLRLFAEGHERVQLERLKVRALPHGRTHLAFRVLSRPDHA